MPYKDKVQANLHTKLRRRSKENIQKSDKWN